MRPVSVLALAVLLMASGAAAAEGDAGDWSGDYGQQGKVRSDFVAGLGGGLAFGRAVGYPNESGKIGRHAFRTNTNLGVGPAYSFWLGGAIKDWFVLAAAFTNSSLSRGDATAYETGFVFRIETYPLFYQGGIFRDLGVQANFGIAGATIHRDGHRVADGGALSLVGLGVVYETWHLYHFAIGPTFDYTHLFSESLKEDVAVLGLRFVYYSRPKKP